MKLRQMMVVARKELTDGFRDKRSIYTILLVSLFGPALITFMLKQFTGQKKAAEEIQVPVVGRQYAPVLVNWLQQQSGVEIVDGPADPESAVRDRKLDLVLAIEKEFAENFGASKPAEVKVFSDSTRQASEPKVKRLTGLLGRFSGEMGSLRLIARGVSPAAVSALDIKDVDVANSQQRAAVLLNVVLMFLVMSIMSAGMQIATDSTAGERERGSLEPLLLNPVPRWQLAGGKWLASAISALLGLTLTLIITAQVLGRLPLEELGVRFHLGPDKMLLLLAAIGPMVFIAPSVQLYLSCFAKSFKEAQSYSAFLIIAVTIPGVLATLTQMGNRPWMQAIPVLAQYALGSEILSGKAPGAVVMVGTALEALAIAGVFLWLTARLFGKEKIVFGR